MKRGFLVFALACGSGVVDEVDVPAPACDQGEVRCDGAVLQLCSEDSWTALEVCLNASLCDPEQGCRPAE